jgi:hypothetical protein
MPYRRHQKGTAVDFGFEAGIGFFLALALCFGVSKIVMVIARGGAHDIALFRRTRRSRTLAKSMEESFRRHAWDPLDSYESALRDVTDLEQYLSTLPPNEEASATAAALVTHAKAVVMVCERALRIERIANILEHIEVDERTSIASYVKLEKDLWGKDMTEAEARAEIAESRERHKADLAAAKTGPLTWWKPDSGYRDANGKVHRLGPRGLGLKPALIAKAVAELNGYHNFTAAQVNRAGTLGNNTLLVAIAAHRIFEQARHQPSWL